MEPMQWVLIAVVVLLIIAYPILMTTRRRKDEQKLIEQTNSLKRGDKILTTSGVYGTILEVREENGAKKVVIETGNDKYKSYMTVDAYAIYTVIKDDEKPAEKVEVKEEPKAEVKEEKTAKAPAKKKATTKKTAKKAK